MVLDLFEYLAPNLKYCKTFDEADKIYKINNNNVKDVKP